MQKIQNAFFSGFTEELEKISGKAGYIIPIAIGGIGGYFAGRKFGKTRRQKRLYGLLGAGGGMAIGGLGKKLLAMRAKPKKLSLSSAHPPSTHIPSATSSSPPKMDYATLARKHLEEEKKLIQPLEDERYRIVNEYQKAKKLREELHDKYPYVLGLRMKNMPIPKELKDIADAMEKAEKNERELGIKAEIAVNRVLEAKKVLRAKQDEELKRHGF